MTSDTTQISGDEDGEMISIIIRSGFAIEMMGKEKRKGSAPFSLFWVICGVNLTKSDGLDVGDLIFFCQRYRGASS